MKKFIFTLIFLFAFQAQCFADNFVLSKDLAISFANDIQLTVANQVTGNVFHKDFVADDNHALPARVYTDIAARDTDTAFHVFINVDKIIRITSPPSYYLLTSVGPVVWAEVTNPESNNLELGKVITPTDGTADGGGITLKGTTDKTITWVKSTNSWKFNQQIDLTNKRIINLGIPNAAQDAATKASVDELIDEINTLSKLLDMDNITGGVDIVVSSGDAILVTDSMSVGGITQPAVGSSIDLKGTNAALLYNRLTTVQRDVLIPLKGMVIYNTNTDDIEFYNGVTWQSIGGGDVVGPASSTDNALVRFNGTTGKSIQNSSAIIDDLGNVTFFGSMKVQGGTNNNKYDPIQLSVSTSFVLANSRGSVNQGNYFYFVNQSDSSLRIVDVTNPALPVLIGTVILNVNGFRSVDVSGNFAYIADDFNDSLRVFNVEDKFNPILIATLPLTGSGALRGIKVSGNIAYLTGQSPAIISVDITDPLKPVQLDVLTVSNNPRPTFDIVGKYAYLPNAGATNDIDIVDISNPSNLFLAGGISLGINAWSNQKENSRLYVVGDNNKLAVFDVVDPSNPILLGSITTLDDPRTINVNNGICYITDTTVGTLKIFDATDPLNIVEISNPLTIGSNPISSNMVGGLIYILDNGSDDFRIVDVSLTNIQNLKAGSSIISDLQIINNLFVAKRINTDSLGVGIGGIKSDGPVSSTIAGVSRLTSRKADNVKDIYISLPVPLILDEKYRLQAPITDALNHIIPASSNTAIVSSHLDHNRYAWTGTGIMLDGSAGIEAFAIDELAIDATGGQFMNILGGGSGFFVIKGGSEVNGFDWLGTIKGHSFNVRGAGFLNNVRGFNIDDCRVNITSFGYIAFSDHNQIMMDIELSTTDRPVSIRGGDISLFAGDTAFFIHNNMTSGSRIIIESNNFGEFLGTPFGKVSGGVISMTDSVIEPGIKTTVTPLVEANSNVRNGDSVIHANFATFPVYDGTHIASNVIINSANGYTTSYDILVVFAGNDTTGDWSNVSLDHTDPRILSVNNSGVFPESKTIGYYLVDDNTTVTTFSGSGVWTNLNLNALATAASNIEEFTLTNTTIGELRYDGLSPFAGKITFTAYVTISGGGQDFEMRAVKNGSALVDTFEPRLNVDSENKIFQITVPVSLVNGDLVRPQALRVGGTSGLIVSHLSMEIN